MLEHAKDEEHLKELQKKNNELLVLAFYGAFSEAAGRALEELERFGSENKDIPLYVIDVQKMKGIHKQYGVSSVPTVAVIKDGEVRYRIEGVQNYRFYERIIMDISAPPPGTGKDGKKNRYVVVYTGSGCPACGSAKRYLRKNRIRFREVDISKDEQAAKRLVARSGQMAVPQIDINGELVVGFDQAKIDRLLSQ